MQLKQLLARLPPPLRSLSLAPERGTYRRAGLGEDQLREPSPEDNRIPERFVQDIWNSRLFDPGRLTTTSGETVAVLDPGRLNKGAGPDFLNARIRIGELDWRGDVEIHYRSSDWIAHKHQYDPRYNSVVLHVSFVADFWTGRLSRPDGSPIPEIVLRPCLAIPLRQMLLMLNARSERGFLCEQSWSDVPDDITYGWIRRMADERVAEQKTLMTAMLPECGTVTELLYRELMRGMGYSKNSDAFYELACRVPSALLRQSPDRFVHEAMLFGVAGLIGTPSKKLDGRKDDYVVQLEKRFFELNDRLEIPVMSPLSWTNFRLRPSNFPTLRIAQCASWFAPGGLLSESSIEQLSVATQSSKPVAGLRTLLAAQPTDYWSTHLRFGNSTSYATRRLGRSRIDSLIGNIVVPILLMVAEQEGNQALARCTRRVAERLPAEHTEVTRKFADAGYAITSAADTRGLHQLYKTRCTQSGCLSCVVGRYLLRESITR